MEGHQERATGAAPFEEGFGGNFSHNMNDNIEVIDEMEDQEESGINTGESGKNKRKKRSTVWKYFTELSVVQPPEGDGKKRAECKKCKIVYICDQNHGTSNMRNHLPKCRGLTEKEIQDLMLKGIEESLSAQPSVRFDSEKFRELLVLAIIRHNLPFIFVEYAGIRDLFAYVNPDIKLVCRNTAKADVVKIYHEQKSLLKNLLQNISSRISLTSDLWTSIAQDGYICLTAHYIDFEWKLQHKILSFSIMPTPHNGVNLCEKLHNILTEWGIDKRLFSLTLDNASVNDVSIDLLKGQLNNRHALLCEGDFFHMRCCAHIINLIVQEGLKEMEVAICKVRDSVRYVRGSLTRRQKFLDCIAQVSLQSTKGFRQDVPTRWNSTFLMLESALYYRRALALLEMSDSNYTYCPSVEEWDRVENVNKFLRVFFEVTSLFSGTSYPTLNLYFPQVFFVQFTISNAMKEHDSYIQQMATRMNAKFEKYWSKYNPLLAIACILDP